MTRNKPRLQLALYSRPQHPGTYQHALFISPKTPKSSRPIIKLHVSKAHLERVTVSTLSSEPGLLVLETIGKVTVSVDKVEQFLKDRFTAADDEEDDGVAWTRDSFEALRRGGLVSGAGRWDGIRANAVQFVERKRLEGRWETDWKGEGGVPTLDVMEGKESVT